MRMMTTTFRALVFLALLPGLVLAQTADAPATAVAEPETLTGPELLSLAAVLIGDGNHTRARTVLARVDEQDEELDRARYHTLSGLVALNLDEQALAQREFEQAIDAGQTEPVIWLYLAQTRFAQQDWQGALDALDRAGAANNRLPSVMLMRAQAHWQLKQYVQAWRTLGQGRELFPDRAGEFARRQVFLLVDQGLYQEAADQGLEFLATEQATVEDALAIGNALRESGEYHQAALVLERSRLSAPDNAMLGKVLAHVYLNQDRALAAAGLMHKSALIDPELLTDAAELYRRAGWPMLALTLNAQVIDQPAKLKQRLALLIETGRFDQAAGMSADLERVGLLADEDIRYALAYALFKSRRFDAAEAQLKQLTRGDLFRRATELRRAMEQCADSPWMCG